jgi:sulfopyruvate decarboxylase TPP-binding subunit
MERTPPDRLLAAIEACAIEWLLVVPSTGLDAVYEAYHRRARCLFATREEEAVAIAAGLALGGSRPLVLMQQSGVGNCLNAVLTLVDPYRIDFPILVGFRPLDDDNPVQRSSAEGTRHAILGRSFATIEWQAEDYVARFRSALEGRTRWIAFAL